MPDNHRRRRSVLKGSGVAALGIALAGCSGEDSKKAANKPGTQATATESKQTATETPPDKIPTGGTLDVGLQAGPSTMNPYTGVSVNDDLVQSMVYTSGTILDPVTYKVRPWVYSDWTAQNADSGEPDIYFNVRDDLTWTDGQPLELTDVLFTYNYLLEQNPGFYSGRLNPIDKVEEASNEYDVHLKLNKRVGAYAIDQLSLPLLRKDIYQGQSLQNFTPGADAVGLGYGRVTKYEPDTAVEIELRDPENFPLTEQKWVQQSDQITEGGPFLDKIRFNIYGGKSAVEQALLNGEVDTIKNTIRASKLGKVEQSERLSPIDGLDSGWRHVLFNLRNDPLGDITFRQALGFLWDDHYYKERLFRGLLIEGDFPIPPGYTPVRPESVANGNVAKHPASNAFQYRRTGGSLDVEGIRSFLVEGKVITGESGTYVGQEYPGSLTGIRSSVTESKHDYSFGSVESESLKNADVAVDKEIRVDGKTIPEILGRELEYVLAPPKSRPRDYKMGLQFVKNMHKLGVPAVTKPMSFDTLNPREFKKEKFDLVQTGWAGISPFGAPSLYTLFHSSFADDHSKVEKGHKKKNGAPYMFNAAGYGLFDEGADELLQKGVQAMDTEKMREYARKAAERIYLDFPIMINGYQIQKWPVNTAEYGGYIKDITSPGQQYMWMQWMSVYQNE